MFVVVGKEDVGVAVAQQGDDPAHRDEDLVVVQSRDFVMQPFDGSVEVGFCQIPPGESRPCV
ncbi:MAG: hypothetical protein R2849_10405 [Thermomicrobiales bacterium]